VKKERKMECYIVKNNVESKAGLEDILPLLDDRLIQFLLRNAYKTIDLSYVLAHMPDEIKDMVYRNLSIRIHGKIKEDVKEMESAYKKDCEYLKSARTELISFIGENINVLFGSPDRLIWKKTEPEEKTQAGFTGQLISKIEDALASGELYLATYETGKMTKEDLENAFAAFNGRKNELRKIHKLTITAGLLPAAAPLFENEGVDTLEIKGEFTGIWPGFLENYGNLTSITLDLYKGLTEFPAWIRKAVSLRGLFISSSSEIKYLPDWIEDMQSLTEISIFSPNFIALPDNIGNLKNLTKLTVNWSAIEKLPDSIGGLSSLNELDLFSRKLTFLPDSIGNLRNLAKLTIDCSPIEKLPLARLELKSSAIEKLPDTLAGCSSLEYLDICNTGFASLPNFIFSIKTLLQSIKILPEKRGISCLSFRNYYYTVVETVFRFSEKARREGLLALEDELDVLTDDFFKTGIRLVVDGTDAAIIRDLLTIKIEREHDYYMKKLMETAMEGILHMQAGERTCLIGMRLASMVDIKNNALETACAKYLSGDFNAFDNIDFKALIQPEEEREEITFIKRAVEISELTRREGWLPVEKLLDNEGIAARDVFEYGLPMAVDNWDYDVIYKDLSLLAARETDPVRKNLALAKKDALAMILAGSNTRILILTLASYFDDEVTKGFLQEILKD